MIVLCAQKMSWLHTFTSRYVTLRCTFCMMFDRAVPNDDIAAYFDVTLRYVTLVYHFIALCAQVIIWLHAVMIRYVTSQLLAQQDDCCTLLFLILSSDDRMIVCFCFSLHGPMTYGYAIASRCCASRSAAQLPTRCVRRSGMQVGFDPQSEGHHAVLLHAISPLFLRSGGCNKSPEVCLCRG